MGDPSGVIHIPDVDPKELVVKENTGGTDKWSLAPTGALQVLPMSTSDGLKGPKIDQKWKIRAYFEKHGYNWFKAHIMVLLDVWEPHG